MLKKKVFAFILLVKYFLGQRIRVGFISVSGFVRSFFTVSRFGWLFSSVASFGSASVCRTVDKVKTILYVHNQFEWFS